MSSLNAALKKRLKT